MRLFIVIKGRYFNNKNLKRKKTNKETDFNQKCETPTVWWKINYFVEIETGVNISTTTTATTTKHGKRNFSSSLSFSFFNNS